MDEVKEVLTLDWRAVLIGIVAIAAFFKVAVDFIKWLVKQFGIEFKSDREKREQHDLLMKTINRMDEMEKIHEHTSKEARHYDERLKDSIDNITKAIDRLSKKVDRMEEKSDATERADLKDRIAQRYRKYTVERQWTSMEKESFMGLIRDYEAHGGKNSFVHDICEPESFTWLVVDEDADK